MSFLSSYPEPEELVRTDRPNGSPLPVNAHIHTPYSFSAFESVAQAFDLARSEGIKVLGINDFYTASGHPEFLAEAKRAKIFPLFNMEFISLSSEERDKGMRVNDPNNPGRMYFCGKGLRSPFSVSTDSQTKIEGVREANARRIQGMVEKVADLLGSVRAPFGLGFEELRTAYAKELVRERHVARAVADKAAKHFGSEDALRRFYTTLFGGSPPKANLNNSAKLEGEIRSRLLKSGGSCYVPESPEAFLEFSEVRDIVVDAGGIPCYPVLLDNEAGEYTEFEGEFEALADNLARKGVPAVELIPVRNGVDALTRFVRFFDERGFVITFGTEHNTPELIPLTVACRDRVPLDDYLRGVGYTGACVVAAHQYLGAKGRDGLGAAGGPVSSKKRAELADLGDGVIRRFLGE